MDAQPVRLFDFPFSGNGYKVRLALHHLGLPVERKRRSQATGAAIAIDDPVGSAHCERLRWWELVTR